MTRLTAPAKVNLYLRVTGLRPDGYHGLDTSFAYVDTGDEIEVSAASAIRVSCSNKMLEGENNLVYRALAAMQEKFGVSEGLHVHIEKHLPEQAGLGGGSSDAATSIIAANQIWGLNLSTTELIEFACNLGADIPCFLFGRASLASGTGEQLAALDDPLPSQPIVLAYPGEGLSTARVFSRFDQEPAAALTPYHCGFTILARSGVNTSINVGENQLESTARTLSPKLAKLLDAMRTRTPCAWMSGSGTACVAIAQDVKAAQGLARHLFGHGFAAWTHVGRLLAEHPLLHQGCWPGDGA